MNDIKIIEYSDKYAKQLAHMWNKSTDNWGGEDTLKTEEDIIEQMKNSGDLNAYLALDGEDIVGYCSFSEYRMDEGASYIPLLNVRPDYHSKKIGKKLVLKAVERAINSDWPRLDLFTWPGNSKAVPLYKKCGFFWENRDDTTHLMNFIPDVLNTDAVKDYFEKLDWYSDNKRNIDIKPDGNVHSKFEFYEYIWENDDIFLRMEYERKGRGLRLIETNDYLVKLYTDKCELVFGKKYKAYYEIINKSGKNLDISVEGLNDKNIDYDLSKTINVKDKEIIESEFYVNEIFEEQSLWRTHPSISSNIKINGKSALFKLGITPKFPIKISLNTLDSTKHLNAQSKLYLDLENNFDEDINIKFKLKDNKLVEFIDKEININLDRKEKKSIEINYKLEKYGFYSEDIDILIKLKNDEIKYNKKLTTSFQGIFGKYHGEDEENWMIFNGKYSAKLIKLENDIIINNNKKNPYDTIIMFPKIGLPYSLEFSKIKGENIEYFIEDDFILMKVDYNSRDFKNIKIISYIKLYNNGLVENYYEVYNNSNNDIRDINICYSVYHNLENMFIPYKDKIVKINGSDGDFYSYWDSKKVSENWIYCNGDIVKRGICWSDDLNLVFDNWYLSLNKNIESIEANNFVKINPITVSWDVYENYEEFRAFSMKNNDLPKLDIVDDFEVSINDGNPFIKDSFNIDVIDYKKNDLKGKINIKSKTQAFKEIKSDILSNDNSYKVQLTNKQNNLIDIINVKANLKGKMLNKEEIVFRSNEGKISFENDVEHDKKVHIADNGVLKIKASHEFSNCLYSIKYNDNEWLDSSFPELKPKAWWNPWNGGINIMPDKYSYESLKKEKKNAEFVTLRDNHNNSWQGIKMTLDITENDDFKGIKIHQYYLMLSNLPILLLVSEIENNTGRYMYDKKFSRNAYIKSSDNHDDSYFKVNNNNKNIKHKTQVEVEINSYKPFTYSGEDRKDKMIIINNNDVVYGYINNKINFNVTNFNLSLGNDEKIFTKPEFIFFSEEDIDHNLLSSLKNIKFK